MASKITWRILVAVVGITLVVLGIADMPNDPRFVSERVRALWPSLQAAWFAISAVSSGTAMLTWLGAEWILRRSFEQRLQSELRRQNEHAVFRETEGRAAARYLMNESVWAWKTYRQYNSWTFVEAFSSDEMHRAALEGDVRMTGLEPNSEKSTLIPRRFWAKAESLVTETYGLYANSRDFGGKRYHHVAVCTVDMHEVWPRASMARRLLTSIYVPCKILWLTWGPPVWLDYAARSYLRWKRASDNKETESHLD
jgi:hypothetical protein